MRRETVARQGMGGGGAGAVAGHPATGGGKPHTAVQPDPTAWGDG